MRQTAPKPPATVRVKAHTRTLTPRKAAAPPPPVAAYEAGGAIGGVGYDELAKHVGVGDATALMQRQKQLDKAGAPGDVSLPGGQDFQGLAAKVGYGEAAKLMQAQQGLSMPAAATHAPAPAAAPAAAAPAAAPASPLDALGAQAAAPKKPGASPPAYTVAPGYNTAPSPLAQMAGATIDTADALPGQYRRGGAVHGGIPGKDSVPILAQEGEYMLPKKSTQAAGGPAALDAFVRATNDGKKPGPVPVAAPASMARKGLTKIPGHAGGGAIGYTYNDPEAMARSYVQQTGMPASPPVSAEEGRRRADALAPTPPRWDAAQTAAAPPPRPASAGPQMPPGQTSNLVNGGEAFTDYGLLGSRTVESGPDASPESQPSRTAVNFARNSQPDPRTVADVGQALKGMSPIKPPPGVLSGQPAGIPGLEGAGTVRKAMESPPATGGAIARAVARGASGSPDQPQPELHPQSRAAVGFDSAVKNDTPGMVAGVSSDISRSQLASGARRENERFGQVTAQGGPDWGGVALQDRIIKGATDAYQGIGSAARSAARAVADPPRRTGMVPIQAGPDWGGVKTQDAIVRAPTPAPDAPVGHQPTPPAFHGLRSAFNLPPTPPANPAPKPGGYIESWMNREKELSAQRETDASAQRSAPSGPDAPQDAALAAPGTPVTGDAPTAASRPTRPGPTFGQIASAITPSFPRASAALADAQREFRDAPTAALGARAGTLGVLSTVGGAAADVVAPLWSGAAGVGYELATGSQYRPPAAGLSPVAAAPVAPSIPGAFGDTQSVAPIAAPAPPAAPAVGPTRAASRSPVRPGPASGLTARPSAPTAPEVLPPRVSRRDDYGANPIYGYDVPRDQQGEFGRAIFSDSARGATPEGLNADIAKNGQGVSSKPDFYNGVDVSRMGSAEFQALKGQMGREAIDDAAAIKYLSLPSGEAGNPTAAAARGLSPAPPPSQQFAAAMDAQDRARTTDAAAEQGKQASAERIATIQTGGRMAAAEQTAKLKADDDYQKARDDAFKMALGDEKTGEPISGQSKIAARTEGDSVIAHLRGRGIASPPAAQLSAAEAEFARERDQWLTVKSAELTASGTDPIKAQSDALTAFSEVVDPATGLTIAQSLKKKRFERFLTKQAQKQG